MNCAEEHMPKCNACGRWMRVIAGTAWKMVYGGWPPGPEREIFRCKRCVERLGPFEPQSGIKPEASCGLFAENFGN